MASSLYLQRKRLVRRLARLRRRMNMKMISSLYLQRKRLVRRLARLRRRMHMKMVSSFTCRGRGW